MEMQKMEAAYDEGSTSAVVLLRALRLTAMVGGGAVECVCDCGVQGYEPAHFAAWAEALTADSLTEPERSDCCGALVVRAPRSVCASVRRHSAPCRRA